MGIFTGVTGKIAINGNDVAYMSTWSFDATTEMIIRQHFGERWTRRIPSIKDWTASADGSVELSVESGQADIIAAWFNDTEIVVTFYLDDDTFFRGPAFIQSQNFNNDAGDAPELSISIEGNGALTYVGPAGAMPLAATTAATTTKKGE